METETKYQQILVVKGWEGMADRLQCLSHCMNYCKKFNAAICVDWRDYMWGQGNEDFHDYFSIVGIPVVTIQQVIERIEQGATINPSAYTAKHIRDVPNELIHFAEFRTELNNDCLKQEGDIIVHNNKGVRMFHINNLLNNLTLVPTIREKLIPKLQVLELPYTSIHLRGTDRKTDSTLQNVLEKYEKLPPHAKARCYVISDMNSLTKEFLAVNPNCRLVDPDAVVLKLPALQQGTHMLPAEALQFYGMTKHELNMNTILDFLVLVFSSWNVGHSESTFTKLSTFLRQGGSDGIRMWLDWKPSRSNLIS